MTDPHDTVRAELTPRGTFKVLAPVSLVVLAAVAWGATVERRQTIQSERIDSTFSAAARIEGRLERIEALLIQGRAAR